MSYQPTGPLPEGHPVVKAPKVGVLLVNLGTPDGTDYWSMRRYLSEFLSDPRIIEVPKLVWQPILQGIILTFRPSKSGAAYRSIWNTEKDESPLRTYTRAQAEGLAAKIGSEQVMVDWAMRYGTPSIPQRLEALTEAGCDRVFVLPLYPQYSGTTTASVHDKLFQAMGAMRRQPALRVAPSFHDDPVYIDALAKSVERHLASLDWEPEVMLASFHGIPKSYFMKGDPYHCHCAKTARLLRERLGWSEDRLKLTFQSRFGPTEWLQPYTDKTIEELAQKGVKRLAVVSPAFISDCVETLEELALEARETFDEHGGEHYTVVPCLNDTEDAIDLLAHLTRRELAGWAELGEDTSVLQQVKQALTG